MQEEVSCVEYEALLQSDLFVARFCRSLVPAVLCHRLSSRAGEWKRCGKTPSGALEKKHGSRVIVLIHRQESVNVLGIPVVRYINIDDSEDVLRAIRLTDKNTPLDFILHTPGGLVLAASQIAKAIKRHPAKTTVFVPHYAMSGGTLIALAANEIVMDPNAVLGPIDPQLGDFPAASVLKVVDAKPIGRIDDATLVLADQSKKAIAQIVALAQELAERKDAGGKSQRHSAASGERRMDA